MIITSQAVDIPVRLNGLESPSTVGCEKSMAAPSVLTLLTAVNPVPVLTLLTAVNPGAVLGHSVAVLERGIRQ